MFQKTGVLIWGYGPFSQASRSQLQFSKEAGETQVLWNLGNPNLSASVSLRFWVSQRGQRMKKYIKDTGSWWRSGTLTTTCTGPRRLRGISWRFRLRMKSWASPESLGDPGGEKKFPLGDGLFLAEPSSLSQSSFAHLGHPDSVKETVCLQWGWEQLKGVRKPLW